MGWNPRGPRGPRYRPGLNGVQEFVQSYGPYDLTKTRLHSGPESCHIRTGGQRR